MWIEFSQWFGTAERVTFVTVPIILKIFSFRSSSVTLLNFEAPFRYRYVPSYFLSFPKGFYPVVECMSYFWFSWFIRDGGTMADKYAKEFPEGILGARRRPSTTCRQVANDLLFSPPIAHPQHRITLASSSAARRFERYFSVPSSYSLWMHRSTTLVKSLEFGRSRRFWASSEVIITCYAEYYIDLIVLCRRMY